MEDMFHIQVKDKLFSKDWSKCFATQILGTKYEKTAVPSYHYVGRTGYHIYGWSARKCRTHLGYTRKVKHQMGVL